MGAPEMRIAAVDQVAAIADRVPARYRALVLVAAFGGLRWGELAGLRRKRVDLERGTVTVAEQLLEVNGAFSLGPPKSAAGRRTVALATAAGGSLREVTDRLGHSTTVAAVRYQHVMADRDAAIARELDRLIEGT